MSVAEVREKWVKALTSGEYKQSSGQLQSDVGFCCLGVLCDLYLKSSTENSTPIGWEDESAADGVKNFRVDDVSVYDMPPEIVAQWAGLTDSEASILAECNDNGETFVELAERIMDRKLA